MSKTKTLQRMLGVATLAMMFGAGSALAQAAKETPKDAAGMTPQNKSGQMSPTGSNDNTSAAATPAQAGESGKSSSAASGSSGTSKSSGSSASGSGASSSASGDTATSKSKSNGAAGKLSRADEKMLKDFAQANISEIEAGKMAQDKTKNDQVKTFAQKMVDDHTTALKQVQAMAEQKGVTLPTEPDTKHKAAMKMMGALDGDKFDAAYMKQGGLNDHKNTHKLLTQMQNKAKDPDLKAMAAKVQPVVDQHLQMAQSIDKDRSTGNMSGSSQGSAGTSGKSASGSGSSGTSSSSGASGK